MRAVILSDFAEPSGGAQKVAVESAVSLAQSGTRVTFIHAVAGADERLNHPSIQRICLNLTDVWRQPQALAALNGVWSSSAVSRLQGALMGLDPREPTVLHLHQWTRAFSPSIFRTLLRAERPLAVTAHDYFIACPNGVYYRFDQEQPCALKPLSIQCLTSACDPRSVAHKAVRVARGFVTAASVSGATFDMVHVSDRGRDALTPFLPGGLRHHRIDNPIAVERRPPAAIAPDARFAYVGRLTREKGAVVAAEAARIADAQILFIGEGPAENEIRRANPHAQILGWRSKPEVEAILRAQVRAVVAPSLWLETGPLTVDEAAAAGVPAIVSSRCGAAERVIDGRTGLVREPAAAAFAAAMLDLADSRQAGAMGAAAYERFWGSPSTPEAHARALNQLYTGMLSARPSPSVSFAGALTGSAK